MLLTDSQAPVSKKDIVSNVKSSVQNILVEDTVVCRICDIRFPYNELGAHSLFCAISSAWHMHLDLNDSTLHKVLVLIIDFLTLVA